MDVRKQLNKIKSESKELMSKHVKYNKAIQDLINAENRDVAERFSTKYAYTKYVNLRVQKAIKKLEKIEKSISKIKNRLYNITEYLDRLEEYEDNKENPFGTWYGFGGPSIDDLSDELDLNDNYDSLDWGSNPWDNNLLK